MPKKFACKTCLIKLQCEKPECEKLIITQTDWINVCKNNICPYCGETLNCHKESSYRREFRCNECNVYFTFQPCHSCMYYSICDIKSTQWEITL